MKRDQRFAPHGMLALNPKAFGLTFTLDEPCGHEVTENNVAIVTIRGPLMHHRSFFFDSYESIKERVALALAENPHMVVLSIDSPGGLVSGVFDTARELRVMAQAAGVDLYAHIDGQGTSAAYALASAAMWIGTSESSDIGSIGIIDTLVDLTAMNEREGISIELVTSGARKADGNPNTAITEETRAVTQGKVDDLAEMFFQLVADHRGLEVDDLRAMQAATFHGPEAITLGLVDEVATLEQTIAFATPGPRPGETEAATKGRYDMALDATIAELRKVAEGDDEEEAEQARKMLSALEDEEESSEDEEREDESTDEEDKPEMEDEEDDSEASTAAIAAQALVKVKKLEAKQKKREEREERERLLASRPDFDKEMVKVLRKAPLALVREAVKDVPKGKPRPKNPKAAAVQPDVQGVRGEGQDKDPSASRLPPDEKKKLDEQMGLSTVTAGVVNHPYKISFGVPVESSKEA